MDCVSIYRFSPFINELGYYRWIIVFFPNNLDFRINDVSLYYRIMPLPIN